MIGKFKIQEVSTLPEWEDSSHKRIILVSNDGLYFGLETEWIKLIDSNSVVTTTANVTGYDEAENSYYYGTSATGEIGFWALPAAPDHIASLFSFAVDPTVDDDTTSGYTKGTLWVNTAEQRFFLCFDETLANAVWNRITTNVELKKSFLL